MLTRLVRLATAAVFGGAAAILVLTALAPAQPARAANFDRYVAPEGRDDTDCSNSALPCLTPQYAINEASSGDVIRIAAGVYTDVHTLAFTTTDPYSFTQIAFISKTLTVSGGYTISDWLTADVVANPTVFDAQGHGRGVTVFGSGTEVVTVTGLTLTGGDYSGLGNPIGVAFRNCRFLGADCGGGFYATRAQIHASNLTVVGNIVSRNRDLGRGGGLALESTLAGSTLDNLTVTGNQAPSVSSYGGGLALDATSSVAINNSTFVGNSAKSGGGGVSIIDPVGQIQMIGVRLETNASGEGAAVYAETYSPSNISLHQVEALTNATSAGDVFTFHIYGDNLHELHFRNVLIAGTTVTFSVPSSGLIHAEVGYHLIGEVTLDAAHVTAAGNEGIALLEVQAVTTGITSTLSSGVVMAAFTNTLVTDLPALFLPAEYEPSQITITADHTLTENVPAISTGVIGSPTIVLTNTVVGQPRLNGDYFPRAFSAAIDAGRNVGEGVDASGAPRDGLPDIGALEAPADTYKRVYLPLLRK